VTLVPVAVPPHKEALGDPGAEVRLELCERAVAGDPGLDVSRVELDRGGPSFTVDTLAALHEDAPEDDLIFIAGGDMARSFPSWRDPQRILRLAILAVAERAGAGRGDIREQLAGLGAADRVAFFEMPRLDIASSDLRRRVADGRPIRHLVPEPVAEAIAEGGLYR
jgi:nicotinate-nucleotide adenylyltransferase